VWRGVAPGRRALAAAMALGLFVTGVAGAVATGYFGGDLSWAQMIAAADAEPLPGWLLAFVIALVVGLPLAIVPAIARGWADALVAKPWGGPVMLGVFALACVLVGYEMLGPLIDDGFEEGGWQLLAAAFALPGAPLAAFACLRLWRV
jgi:hypothetical protein